MHLNRWLSNTVNQSADGRYRHRLLVEDPALRVEIVEELREYVESAHEDVRRHLRDVGRFNLDPLQEPPDNDPTEGYPQCLHIQTLKSYFGEIFPAIVAENLAPFDEDGWIVPAFMFRLHLPAIQQLEDIRQTGLPAGQIPGRTGDDCLAFRRDNNGRIIGALCCEAKCTQNHERSLIRDAHTKISDPRLYPQDVLRLIEILRSYDDPESLGWIESLHQLRLHYREPDYERYDLVSYICGRAPVRTQTWISSSTPATEYTGGRKLESVEVHLQDVLGLVRQVYDIEGDR